MRGGKRNVVSNAWKSASAFPVVRSHLDGFEQFREMTAADSKILFAHALHLLEDKNNDRNTSIDENDHANALAHGFFAEHGKDEHEWPLPGEHVLQVRVRKVKGLPEVFVRKIPKRDTAK